MSFISKRERVFNDYELLDLPPRNECKLKAYASCTDARAWSHFGSDKSEHLVEIIKRNNETCAHKYIPTKVIVETLMITKNTEIARLKRKIEEFEQMMAIYDQLELDSEQRLEIAKAHEEIRNANKDLDELYLDLDNSGYTEGLDSEPFETGKSKDIETGKSKFSMSEKSRGDECSFDNIYILRQPTETKYVQYAPINDNTFYNAGTMARDPRIDELQEMIICKDAKIIAMRNTIAVLENEVCEPYCIYAHIYTALEKIFGVLSQNEKYKQYLNMLTLGKDIRMIDIKGKILFKMKVFEKFCLALITPCAEDDGLDENENIGLNEIRVGRVETTLSLKTDPGPSVPLESKRAQLIAEILENDDIKDYFVKDEPLKRFSDNHDPLGVEPYNIDAENIVRLKHLQTNYDELVTCYENVKHDRDILLEKSAKCEEVNSELDELRNQLKQYAAVWNEKEYYRKRSEDLDNLKENFLVLSEETSTLETQYNAENEISNNRMRKMEELRVSNLELEDRINELTIAFEKQQNTLQCKLKETECHCMCQEQQIKSLSAQIDRLLEQQQDKPHQDLPSSLLLINEIEAQKEQISNLKDVLFCSEEEKKMLQDKFKEHLDEINSLKIEVEDWKSNYEKAMQRNAYLEEYANQYKDQVERMCDENQKLSDEMAAKKLAIENLVKVIDSKSYENDKLIHEIEMKNHENNRLLGKIQDLRDEQSSINIDKNNALESLNLERKNSQDLLYRIKNYDEHMQQQGQSLQKQMQDYDNLKTRLQEAMNKNSTLEADLIKLEKNNSMLLNEISRLERANMSTSQDVNALKLEKNQLERTSELVKKQSQTLQQKLSDLDIEQDKLKDAFNKLNNEKLSLEMDLKNKSMELEHALGSVQISQKQSNELLELRRSLEEDLSKSSEAYKKLINEKALLQQQIASRDKELKMLVDALDRLKNQKTEQTAKAENDIYNLKKAYDELLAEKNMLQVDFDNKTEEINHLYNTLENKIEENRNLTGKLKELEEDRISARSSIEALEQDKIDRDALLDKIKYYQLLESDFEKLKKAHNQTTKDRDALETKLNNQLASLKKMEDENKELSKQTENIMSENKTLELALAAARMDSPTNGETSESSYSYIIAEVDALKKEKLAQQEKIRDLLNRLDQSENLVLEMNEDLVARNDRIAILQNHINALEEEINELHKHVEHAVATGEEMRDVSLDKIDHTLKKMEAHHSKATHNMKLEIAKLNEHRSSIEEGLSLSKQEAERAHNDKFRLELNISQLQNEKELVATEIKQLEISTVGDSNLSPRKCEFDAIITSLNRIARAFDGVSSKKSDLENTLLKVQTSSHIVLNKADEAKKIAEKEKQKIINEKEEAIRQRLKLEKQMEDMKSSLKAEIERDKNVIQDLEQEIMNQNLLMNKINQSTQDYVAKLNEELQSLQNRYQDAQDRNRELEDKLKNTIGDYQEKLETLDKVTKDLELQSNQISALQQELSALKCKRTAKDVAVQTSFSIPKRNMATDTPPEIISIQAPSQIMIDELNERKYKHTSEKSGIDDLTTNQNLNYVNELTVQRANLDPAFDLFRNSYQSFKTKQLSTGPLEQHSFASPSQTEASSRVQNKGPDTLEQSPRSQNIHHKSQLKSKQEHPESRKTKYQEYTISPTQTTSDINEYNLLKQEKPLVLSNSDHLINQFVDKTSTAMNGTDDRFSKYNQNKLNYSIKDPKSSKKLTLEYDNDTNYPKREVNAMKLHDKDLDKQIGSNKRKNQTNDLEGSTKDRNYQENKSSYRDPINPKVKIDNQKYKEKKKPGLNDENQPSESASIPPLSSSDDQDMLVIYQEKNSKSTPNKENKHPWTGMTNVTVENMIVSPRNITQPSKESSSDPGRTMAIASPRTNTKDMKNKQPKNLDSYTTSFETINTYSKEPNSVEALQGDVSTEQDHRDQRFSDFTFDSKSEPKMKSNHYPTTNIKPHSPHSKNAIIEFTESPSWPATTSSDRMDNEEIRNLKAKIILNIDDDAAAKTPSTVDKGILVKTDEMTEYEDKIETLTKALENMEKDCKKKLEAIKLQYDANVKSIINGHNEGVKSIQNLHEDTLQDIIKIHDNEIESLRTMSIDAMRKVDKLEKENETLKIRVKDCSCGCYGDKPSPRSEVKNEQKKRKQSSRTTKVLTKTNIEAFNVRPKTPRLGPCTCSVDTGVNDTIKSIFEQVDMEQRKLAEIAYIKYIGNKILSGNIEKLDGQELAFLHYKVCRTWKQKMNKEEAIKKRIDSLESELLNKQRNAQQHMYKSEKIPTVQPRGHLLKEEDANLLAELDRRVAEERRRLDEAREAVCFSLPGVSKRFSNREELDINSPPAPPSSNAERDFSCSCQDLTAGIADSGSAGDLDMDVLLPNPNRPNRLKCASNRAVLAKLTTTRPERRLLDETPTRLKRDRIGTRHRK